METVCISTISHYFSTKLQFIGINTNSTTVVLLSGNILESNLKENFFSKFLGILFMILNPQNARAKLFFELTSIKFHIHIVIIHQFFSTRYLLCL